MNEIIFQTENITKSYKQVHVLDHVNMTVKRGEIAIANGLHYRRTFFVSGDDRNGKLRGSAAAAGNPWKRKS